MISNPNTARRISDLMLEAFYRLDGSCRIVSESCSEQEAAAYREAVEKITTPLVLDVLEPLYEQHPELKPPQWDEDPADEPSM